MGTQDRCIEFDNINTINETHGTLLPPAAEFRAISNTKSLGFFVHDLLCNYKNWIQIYLPLMIYTTVGAVLVGLLFANSGQDASKVASNLSFIFFNMIFLMFASIATTTLSFSKNMSTIRKERAGSFFPKIDLFYTIFTIVDMLVQVIFCVIYVTIVYFMTSQPHQINRYFMFLGICILITFVSQAICLFFSSIINFQIGVFLIPLGTITTLLFSGYFIPFQNIPSYLRYMTYTSHLSYGYEGLVVAVYGFGRSSLTCFNTYCHFKFPRTILIQHDIEDSDYITNVLVLLVMFFVIRAGAFICFKIKVK